MSDPYDYWLNPGRGYHDGSKSGRITPYLNFISFNNVVPLDEQLGVWPIQNVPDALAPQLFGEAETNTFAITDPQNLPGGVEDIENCGLPYRCLFKGSAAEDRREEAPYIIQLTMDAPFTRKLFTNYERGFGLWGWSAVMFTTSNASLEEACDHFRSFTRFADENGKWFHLRFWDGSIFSDYWRHFATSYDRIARFFCSRDFSYSFKIFLQHKDMTTCVSPDAEALSKQDRTIKPFSLNADDFAFFQAKIDQRLKSNVAAELAERMVEAPNDKKEGITQTVDICFDFIRARSRGVPMTADMCLTLSFLVLIWDKLAEDILRGPVLSEPLAAIGHRIELAKMTYFETINRLIESEN